MTLLSQYLTHPKAHTVPVKDADVFFDQRCVQLATVAMEK